MEKLSYILGMLQMHQNSRSTSQAGQQFNWTPEHVLSQYQLALANKTQHSGDEMETKRRPNASPSPSPFLDGYQDPSLCPLLSPPPSKKHTMEPQAVSKLNVHPFNQKQHSCYM